MPQRQVFSVILAASFFVAAMAAIGISLSGDDGCGRDRSVQVEVETSGDASGLTVLAGSELSDVAPMLPCLEQATGVRLELELVGTLEGAELIHSGDRKPAMSWFASSRYLDLIAPDPTRRKKSIMRSPIIIGVRESKARDLGWDEGTVTWKEVAEKAGRGEFTFGATDPGSSNSGFSALVSVASAFDSEELTSLAATRGVKKFFTGRKLGSPSSGFLAEAYAKDPTNFDGLVNYESRLLTLNDELKEKGVEPLKLLAPSEGAVIGDYPLMLENPRFKDAWDAVTSWLLRPAIQRKLMKLTARRPSREVREVRPDDPFSTEPPELPLPSTRKDIGALLASYNKARKPAHLIFALDVSSSMVKNGRLTDLKSAMESLTGADPSQTAQFASFREDEKITLIKFSTNVGPARDFVIDAQGVELERLREYVTRLQVESGTSLFDAVAKAYRVAERDRRDDLDHERVTSIVVMTDGEDSGGGLLRSPRALDAEISNAVGRFPTYVIKIGEAGHDLDGVVDDSAGDYHDASETDLKTAFKKIRGYE